jgi:hypothetical protein
VAKAAWSPLNDKNHQNRTKKIARRGPGAQAYRENFQKRDFSKSDPEKSLFTKFYVGRGGSKEPPDGIIYFWAVISP